MNSIDTIEKYYLLNVNPFDFINGLEAAYIFNDWIQNDQYLDLNYNSPLTKDAPIYNNVAIIGIYNIVSNVVSIFLYDLLSLKHKKEFKNIIKPFDLNSGICIDIKCNTFSFNSDNDNKTSFIYSFNGYKIEDYIHTKGLSIYEHRIYMPKVAKNDFLRNSLFLYESFVENIFDKLEYF